ncbi:hypothetical protein BDAP_002618 [Binucleata daphniae]
MRSQNFLQNDEFLQLIKGKNSMQGNIPAVFKTIKKNEDNKDIKNDVEHIKSYRQVIITNKMSQNIKENLVSKLNVMLKEKVKKIQDEEKKDDSMCDESDLENLSKKIHIENNDTTMLGSVARIKNGDKKLAKRQGFYSCHEFNKKEFELKQIKFTCKNGKKNCLCYGLEYLKKKNSTLFMIF